MPTLTPTHFLTDSVEEEAAPEAVESAEEKTYEFAEEEAAPEVSVAT